MASTRPAFTINTGASIPPLGFGTWLDDEKQEAAILEALRLGYRHIDTAQVYGTEAAVAAAIKKSGVPRDQIFLTTKIWNNSHHPDDVRPAVEASLRRLETDYVDLLLMHYPLAFARGSEMFPMTDTGVAKLGDTDYVDTWREMEKLVTIHQARAIGVSNFSQSELERLLARSTIVPAVHQMEMHPYLSQVKFLEWHREKGIHVTQFSSLGNTNPFYDTHAGPRSPPAKLLDDPVLMRVGRKHGASPAQVALAWGMHHGRSVLTKSVTKERIEENFASRLVSLDEDDMQAIDALDKKARFDDASKMFGYHLYADLDRRAPGVTDPTI